MRLIFHTFMIWLLLLAVPVQSFAATTMAMCDPIVVAAHQKTLGSEHAHAVQPGVHTHVVHDHHLHEHTTMLAQDDHVHPWSANQHDDGHLRHAGAKCGSCATCCLFFMMSGCASVSVEPAVTATALFFSIVNFPVSIVPAHPERPPQASFA